MIGHVLSRARKCWGGGRTAAPCRLHNRHRRPIGLAFRTILSPHLPLSSSPHLTAACVFWLSLFSLSGCAGYQIGNQSLFPTEVHTVYVPMIQSNSFRPNLGERLTEAVVKEIENRTPYKVVGQDQADSVLTATIVNEGKHVLVPDLSGDAREIQVAMTVRVNWSDKKGRVFREEKSIPLSSEFVDITGTGNVAAEVGQSVDVAQQQAINRMAEQIVGLMEKPW
jgi:hypothetical protein